MKIRNLILTACFSILLMPARGEEGLWIPVLLQHYNIDIMQKQGLKLSAEEIYSINQASLKDAIVIFGGGCTGELISESGLILTNHHCGFSAIQSHSSVSKDYLTEGFWANSRAEELPCPSLKVTFLVRMEDVTSLILDSITSATSEEKRDSIVLARVNLLKTESVKNTGYKSVIKPFYFGNEYYMFIYQEYTDIRLVGAPPNAIGNYGEDFDNWVWPRHTGDFSMFRIYAGKDNEPAAYSIDNTPYKSIRHLKISTAGIKEGDFTMVMGYPGTTNEYIIADEISLMLNSLLPRKVDIRDARLKIIDKYMRQSDTTRIMYASKYRSISNAWKKWQGVIIGLESTDALTQKRRIEEQFQKWTQTSPFRVKEYGNVLENLRKLNSEISRYSLVYEYSGECIMAAEITDFALDCNSLISSSINLSQQEKEDAITKFKISAKGFYKDYNQAVDEEIYAAMLRFFYRDIDKQFHPEFFNEINTRYKGDFKKFASETFKKSIFNKQDALIALLDQFPDNSQKVNKRILKDPVMVLFKSYSDIYYNQVVPYYNAINSEMQILYRTYIRGLREMQEEKVFYPDANFTMRVAYGKVEGYKPSDGIIYEHATNLTGVMEKYHSDTVNYSLPPRLIELYTKKEYGKWADENGEIPVCFAASNHTSGGNSGSPVLNANGELIGINFDRNWEGTMSDIYYDVSICRNISVDIRYILFIIDKYANAGFLLDEMDIL